MFTTVITGGARGIGAAAVRLFAARGDRVYFLYEKNKQAADCLSAETGATALQADVACRADVLRVFSQIDAVDLLVNNAGIAHMGLISQIDERAWDRLFAVNVKGIYHCVNAALPAMLRAQCGCVVNIASIWGLTGASCEVCYSATKGAVIALTKALAKELGPSGIRVNCVAPGTVETDMLADISRETLDALKEETPLGRNATPADVAQAIAYLAEATFVTGQILTVDGGFAI